METSGEEHAGADALATLCRFLSRLDRRWLALLPALVVLLIYLPAVRYDFVWDDTIFLRDLPVYRDPGMWWSALFRPFVLSPNYFRPLALLTFVIELRLVGIHPTLFHLTNLLLHAFNTGLLTLLALRLLRRDVSSPGMQAPTPTFQLVASLGAGLLYGLHPALVEGVAFVSSRFDLLMTTFLLLAFLVDAGARRRGVRAALVGGTFLLAALAKEMALAFALALPFWHLACQEQPPVRPSDWWKRVRERGDLLVYGSVLVAGLIYLLIRYLSLGHLLIAEVGKSIPPGEPLQHLALFVKSVGSYLLVVLWPFATLTPIHFSELPVTRSDPMLWVSFVLVGLFTAGLVWLLRRAPRAGWLALGGLVALLPVANLRPLELGGGAFVAERYLLFPLLLFALAILFLWQPLYRGDFPTLRNWRVALLALPLLWLVASLATIQLVLPHWRDDMSLWTWTAIRAPRSPTPPTNLALQHIRLGMYDQALQLADEAIQLAPQEADAWDNAGLALFYMERYEEAQNAFAQAVELEPHNALFWNNLAGALRERGELAQAERLLLEQVLQLDPSLPIAHLNLGIVYLRADRPDLAVGHLEEALRLLPPSETTAAQAFLQQTQEPERWLRLGDLLLSNGEYDAAAQAFYQADALGAPAADVGSGLSSALIGLQNWDGAVEVLNLALEIAPDDPRLYNNLGVVARELGEIEQARQLFGRAIELAPDWELPQQNLQALPEP